MEYRVDLTDEALDNIRDINSFIKAEHVPAAAASYRGLRSMILSLDSEPQRGRITVESPSLRQLLYGNKPHIYRIIYSIDLERRAVRIVHIRHGARRAFPPGEFSAVGE